MLRDNPAWLLLLHRGNQPVSAINVPAETGEPYTVEHHGTKIRVRRKSEFNAFVHNLVFRRSEAIEVANAIIDLIEQDN